MADPQMDQSGVLLVDKAPDWTSHDVVKFVRRFGIRKVGHCGTLDPSATGLLVLVLGRATKLSNQFSGQDKTYQCTMELGTETFTQDAEGEVTASHDWSEITPEQVTGVCADFIGPQEQIPPMVSAIKQKGRKLYELAREGKVVKRPPRPITIHALTVDKIHLPAIDFTVHCSKGTYVRTLSADIGKRLGCGAHLKHLRRLASGNFHVDDAFPLEEIRSWDLETLYKHFMPLEQALCHV